VIRWILWLTGGVVLGAVIHIAVILSLPLLATDTLWPRIASLEAINRPVVLQAARVGEPNPLRLDPELAYAVCQIDLRNGPGLVQGALPQAFWSVAVYGASGNVIYSTTNRDGIGQMLALGIFNAVQTRQLAEQQLDLAEGLLIVESREDDVIVLVRLAPPHQVVRPRYEAALAAIACRNQAG
jgi:uncharacterized membrane protein